MYIEKINIYLKMETLISLFSSEEKIGKMRTKGIFKTYLSYDFDIKKNISYLGDNMFPSVEPAWSYSYDTTLPIKSQF
jgi:hypothetical protein